MHVGGATVAASPGLSLQVTVPATGRIRLLRNRVEQHARTARTMVVHEVPPGVYCVEAATQGGKSWLFSSSIRVVGTASGG